MYTDRIHYGDESSSLFNKCERNFHSTQTAHPVYNLNVIRRIRTSFPFVISICSYFDSLV